MDCEPLERLLGERLRSFGLGEREKALTVGRIVVDEPCKGETMRANHEGHPKPLVERMGRATEPKLFVRRLCKRQWRVAPDAKSVVVCIRPEQIELRAGLNASGLAGRVLRCAYHGHDVVVTVRPDQGDESQAIVSRVTGNLWFEPGVSVTMRARGPVLAWPEQVNRNLVS